MASAARHLDPAIPPEQFKYRLHLHPPTMNGRVRSWLCANLGLSPPNDLDQLRDRVSLSLRMQGK
jgi:hypothetical protein